MKHLLPARSLAFAAIGLAVAPAVAQGLLVTKGQVLLADGDPVAALPGVVIGGASSVDQPVMDQAGNVYFRARMTGPGLVPQTDRAYFAGRTSADLRMILQSGSPDPSGTMPGVTLNTAAGTGIGSTLGIRQLGGFVMYGAALSGPGIVNSGGAANGQNDSILYWGVPGTPMIVLARRGDLTPGGGGSRFDSAFNAITAQTTALGATIAGCFKVKLAGGDVVGTTNNEAWVYGLPGSLQILQRKGSLDLGGTVGIAALGYNCMMNESGQVLHDETLSTTLGSNPATSANDKVVFVWTPGVGNRPVIREGDPAVGTVGAAYGTLWLGANVFTKSGRTVIGLDLVGGDVVAGSNDYALYTGTVDGLSLAARRGDPAPGTGGQRLGVFNYSSLTCNDSGSVAFVASLQPDAAVTTANDSGIWTGKPGQLQLVAREGDPAPGIAGGVFSSIVGGTSQPNMNARGQILFGCSVLVGTTSVAAQYGYDPELGLVLLLAAGDTLTTAQGPQTVMNAGALQFSSGDGSPLCLNNNGDFCLSVYFASGGSAVVRGHIGALQGTPSVIARTGGTHVLDLDAGIANAGKIYLVVGTMSGTRPGFDIGGVHVPLMLDPWFDVTINNPNNAVLNNTLGFLDAQGKATAAFHLPAGFATLAGTNLHHAFVVVDGYGNPTFASEPAGVLIH